METTNDTENPAQGPPYPPPPRLTRSTDDKVVSGLCGGLGRHFGVDPVVFRIAFVVLALAGGSGVLAYLVGWLLIPDDRGGALVTPRATGRPSKLVATVLLGLGALAVLSQIFGDHDGDFPVALVLLGVGAAVLWSRRDDRQSGAPPPPVTGGGGGPGPAATLPGLPPLPSPPALPPPPALPGPGAVPFGAAGAAAPAPTRPPRPPKPRSTLVPVTLSLLALLAGGLALLHTAGAVSVSLPVAFALGLLLTGAAMVVGAWRGRARWLIPVGLVLATGLAVTSVIDVPLRGGTGDRLFRPTTAADLESPYRLAAGKLVLDLSGLDLGGGAATVVSSVATGELDVVVPDAAAVAVDAHVGAGNVELFRRMSGGFDIDRRRDVPGAEGAGRLVLRLRAGVGQVTVHRASA